MARRGEAWRRRLRLNIDRGVAERRRSGMFTSLSTGALSSIFGGGSLGKRPNAYNHWGMATI